MTRVMGFGKHKMKRNDTNKAKPALHTEVTVTSERKGCSDRMWRHQTNAKHLSARLQICRGGHFCPPAWHEMALGAGSRLAWMCGSTLAAPAPKTNSTEQKSEVVLTQGARCSGASSGCSRPAPALGDWPLAHVTR